MSTPETVSEREDIEMLLPWYVTGKLDASDRAKVDAYLTRDPAMRHQMALIQDEQTASISANEAIVAPRTLTVERSMQAVAAKTSLGTRQAASGFLGVVRAWFDHPSARGVRYAAIAAAAVFVLQSATIGALISQSQTYTTASGTNAAEGATVIVKFRDEVSVQSIAAALAQRDMTIVDGPKTGGTFVVRLGAGTISQAERQQRISDLRSLSGVISLVLP